MKDKFWKLILNHKFIALIGFIGFILAIVFGIFSIYAYFYPIQIESNIIISNNSGNIINKSNSVISNNSGNIVNKNNSIIKNDLILQNSIYDVINKMNETDFTKQKIEIRESVMGFYVEDEGYIYDVDNYNQDNIDYIKVIISQTHDYKNKLICIFDKNWEKIIGMLHKGNKINFTGKIAGGKNFNSIFAENKDIPLIALSKCELIK